MSKKRRALLRETMLLLEGEVNTSSSEELQTVLSSLKKLVRPPRRLDMGKIELELRQGYMPSTQELNYAYEWFDSLFDKLAQLDPRWGLPKEEAFKLAAKCKDLLRTKEAFKDLQ